MRITASNKFDALDPNDGEKSVAETLVRDVIRGLYDGRFEPGQRLYEAQLTSIYGISRGPLREAFNKLSAIGIVDLTMQRGARVKVLTINEALDTLVVAQTLVSLAAKLAATHIAKPGAKARMKAASDKLTTFDPSANSADFARARDSFYATLTDIADNTQLKLILPMVRIHLIRVQFRALLHQTDAKRHSDYRRIAQAVLSGQSTEAATAARNHFMHAITALETFRAK
jgi:DNA-binding GntR family transcriptional regulator